MRALTLALLALTAACRAQDAATVLPEPPCSGRCTPPHFSSLALVAGQPGGPGFTDGTGAAAHFSDPWTFASDGSTLYLIDGSAVRALDLASAGVTTLTGGFGRVGGTDGPLAQATFYGPSGLAIDAAGRALYVADTENSTVRRIDLAAGMVTTLTGAYQDPGDADGPLAQARFDEPQGLAFDGKGTLYVADTGNHSVRAVALATGQVSTLATGFDNPSALTFDGVDTLYLVESGNATLRSVRASDGSAGMVAQLPGGPLGLTVEKSSNGATLLVSLADERVVRVATATGAVTVLAGTEGQAGFEDGAAGEARFRTPAGLYDDGDGTLYLADEANAAVRRIALGGGAVTTWAGARSTGARDGTGNEARFSQPQGLAVSSAGMAFVADTENHTLRQVELATGVTRTLAGAAGQPGNVNGALGEARFSSPAGLALDEAANALYIADTGNRALRRLDLASGQVSTVPADIEAPLGLALDGRRLLVSDYQAHVIVAVALETGASTVVAGASHKPGAVDGLADRARFNTPEGLAADGHGLLYVADVRNDLVRVVDLAHGTVATVAGVAGIEGTTDGPAATARFAYPSSLAVDALGDLFVGDARNNVVRRIDLRARRVSTVIGTPSVWGVLPGPLPAQLTAPTAIALTSDGALALFSESALLIAQ